ncbi:hypothetical protein EON80_11685 [bacterium]|nr:MAG: hypothetical protein EON80_11685 [bacterium]
MCYPEPFNFSGAMGCLNRVNEQIKKANHHHGVNIRYNRVALSSVGPDADDLMNSICVLGPFNLWAFCCVRLASPLVFCIEAPFTVKFDG